MRARTALGVVLGAALGAALGGCRADAPTGAAEAAPGLVLFGVLNPAGTEQVVLLMRSRSTAPSTAGLVFNPADPIVTIGETPVTGARVVVSNAAGDSAVLVEDRVRRPDRLGAGVYRLFTGAPAAAPTGAYLALRPAQLYRVRVRSTLGEAEGAARVPSASPAPVTAIAGAAGGGFVLGRDSVVLPPIAVSAAAGFVYSLRTPTGAQEGDTQYRGALERRLVLPAGEGWAFAYARDRLADGATHVLTVVAADSSYFAYYSADTDPFADRSSRTTLRGAAGVFGAVLPIAAVPLRVGGVAGTAARASTRASARDSAP